MGFEYVKRLRKLLSMFECVRMCLNVCMRLNAFECLSVFERVRRNRMCLNVFERVWMCFE